MEISCIQMFVRPRMILWSQYIHRFIDADEFSSKRPYQRVLYGSHQIAINPINGAKDKSMVQRFKPPAEGKGLGYKSHRIPTIPLIAMCLLFSLRVYFLIN